MTTDKRTSTKLLETCWQAVRRLKHRNIPSVLPAESRIPNDVHTNGGLCGLAFGREAEGGERERKRDRGMDGVVRRRRRNCSLPAASRGSFSCLTLSFTNWREGAGGKEGEPKTRSPLNGSTNQQTRALGDDGTLRSGLAPAQESAHRAVTSCGPRRFVPMLEAGQGGLIAVGSQVDRSNSH